MNDPSCTVLNPKAWSGCGGRESAGGGRGRGGDVQRGLRLGRQRRSAGGWSGCGMCPATAATAWSTRRGPWQPAPSPPERQVRPDGTLHCGCDRVGGGASVSFFHQGASKSRELHRNEPSQISNLCFVLFGVPFAQTSRKTRHGFSSIENHFGFE